MQINVKVEPGCWAASGTEAASAERHLLDRRPDHLVDGGGFPAPELLVVVGNNIKLAASRASYDDRLVSSAQSGRPCFPPALDPLGVGDRLVSISVPGSRRWRPWPAPPSKRTPVL